MKTCISCKYWGVNRDIILNGVENAHVDISSHCESGDLQNCIHVNETKLPSYIIPFFHKRFICNNEFGCVFWKLYKNWKKVYK